MIIRSIRVEGWRCFADAVEIGPFGEGLNVVYGRNGVGKSTLFTALVRCMFDKHNSKGEATKSLRPWGRELAPCVTLEFDRDGHGYRLRKQFLVSPRAELGRRENGRFVPLAEGPSADDQVRQMLSGEERRGGAVEPAHWGLAQILWAPQGKLELGQLSSAARQTIQQSLGAQVAGESTSAVEQRIAARYGRIFTPTGKLRSGADASPLVAMQEQLAQAQARKDKLQQRLAAFDDAVRSIEDTRLVASQSRRKLDDLETQQQKAQVRADEYQSLLGEKDRHAQAADAARARFEQLKTLIDSIRECREEVQRCEKTIASLENDAPALAAEVRHQSSAADQANTAVEEVRARRDEVKNAKRLAATADRHARLRQQLAEHEELLRRVDEAHEELAQLTARRGAIRAPDAKTLQALQKASRARDDARLQLDASLITVTFQAEADVSLETLRAEIPLNEKLASGTELRIKGSPDVAVRIPGVGVIRATGPTTSAEQLRRQWEDAAAKFDELIAQWTTHDLDELQQTSAAAAVLDQQTAQARTRLETLLRGKPADQLRHDRQQQRMQLEEIVATQPTWREAPPQAAAMLLDAERLERQFEEQIDTAEVQRTQAVDALSAASQKLARHEENLKNAQQQLQSARQRLAQASSDGKSDDDRQKLLDELSLQWHATQAALRASEDKLKQFGSDPRDEVKVLARQVQALREETANHSLLVSREEGRLQTIIAEAPYSALAAEEETIAELTGKLAREQLQASAVQLLHETLTRRKRQLIESLVGPVRQRAMQTLQRITGSRFDGLELTDTFDVTGIVPRNVTEPISLGELSGGEQEQVHFAVRLALADIALTSQRQLVVLDDVFTFTDTARLARIVQILEEAAERFQIVMLTCHPERYRGLPGATFFDLEQITACGAAN